jgi:hypothetical protein
MATYGGMRVPRPATQMATDTIPVTIIVKVPTPTSRTLPLIFSWPWGVCVSGAR